MGSSGFVAVTLPAGGGVAEETLLCAIAQDTGENYNPGLGYDPNATVRGMNDGKCDRAGRFWAGSVLTPHGMALGPDSSPGNLWRLSHDGGAGGSHRAEVALKSVGCSQGPA